MNRFCGPWGHTAGTPYKEPHKQVETWKWVIGLTRVFLQQRESLLLQPPLWFSWIVNSLAIKKRHHLLQGYYSLIRMHTLHFLHNGNPKLIVLFWRCYLCAKSFLGARMLITCCCGMLLPIYYGLMAKPQGQSGTLMALMVDAFS